MEQGRTEEGMKQQQDQHHRRLKPPVQTENQPHHQQPQQPQKCPRCDSLNTKFCYYNNYSLSQPRYFCKTCRRYWTQGGTLRNVPVGGGCRKGKRAKAASSSGGENSKSQPSPTAASQSLAPSANSGTPTSLALRNKELGNMAIPPMSSYYSGGGFLSSLAAMQSFSQAQPFNQPLNVGGSSNLALLQGFNVPSFSSQQAQNQQIQQQNEFYQMGNSDQSLIHPNRPIGWNQSLTNPTASNPSFWNSSTSNASYRSNTGTSLNPNQWPDLSGYGPPP